MSSDSQVRSRVSRCLRPLLVGLSLLAGLPAPTRAEEPRPFAAAAAMAARVDALLFERWTAEGLTPAPRASDAEFMRRVYLDLTGIIPKVSEVREFLRDESPDKRARLIEELLARPTHSVHLSNTWRHILLPGEADVQAGGDVAGFQNWLRQQFADNVRYDAVVADLLMARGTARQNGPALFYTSLELKPEEIAASTSRIFLGVQIQCAQCHDHPFDRWKQQDFWGYAAFFARLQQRQADITNVIQVEDAPTGEVKLPNTDEVVKPKYLDWREANPDNDDNRRRQLAIWLVSRDNPFFARASVNRVWAHLFGRGIVDPVDDFSERNPPSHPQLLDELAAYFVETGFDLRGLFRVLANTEAYQLSSESLETEEEPRPELFARMAVKSLTPEQLYDCLAEATRRREMISAAQRANGSSRFQDPDRLEFIARFQAPTQSAVEFQSGIPQALTLMNGRTITEATDLERSGLLAALAAPIFNDDERVEIMFLSTLTRLPSDEERARFASYVESGGPAGDRRQALGDLLWALLNSAEFILNH